MPPSGKGVLFLFHRWGSEAQADEIFGQGSTESLKQSQNLNPHPEAQSSALTTRTSSLQSQLTLCSCRSTTVLWTEHVLSVTLVHLNGWYSWSKYIRWGNAISGHFKKQNFFLIIFSKHLHLYLCICGLVTVLLQQQLLIMNLKMAECSLRYYEGVAINHLPFSILLSEY